MWFYFLILVGCITVILLLVLLGLKSIYARLGKIMSQADAFNASIQRNTKATQDAVAALGGQVASTPDSVVTAGIAQIDANSAALEAVVAPPVVAPPAAPAP